MVVVAAIALALAQFGDDVSRATEVLLLVLPVATMAVLGRRWSAYVVAGAATIAFWLLIPPVGSAAVALFADVVGLIVFFIVAVTVTTLVANRIETLERVENDRRILMRSVSHDLRTPLTTIRAATSELLDGAEHDEATRRRLLEMVGDEADRLDRLVANLLNLSRIEAGALEPDRREVDLLELVEACLARLDRVLTDVEVVVEVAEDLPILRADVTLVDLALTNLLENAARHTPPGGRVTLAATSSGDTMTITVADTGPGLDAPMTEAIFEPFRTGAIAGTSGIGLATCRAVVDAHGGTITAGESPGGGALFTIALPLR